jgi:hypothetical protein
MALGDALVAGVALDAGVTGGVVDPPALHPVRVARMSRVVPGTMWRIGRMRDSSVDGQCADAGQGVRERGERAGPLDHDAGGR